MHCNKHRANNCFECAIENQTKAMVEAIRPKNTKKPNVPRPSKPIERPPTVEWLKTGQSKHSEFLLGVFAGILIAGVVISIIQELPN